MIRFFSIKKTLFLGLYFIAFSFNSWATTQNQGPKQIKSELYYQEFSDEDDFNFYDQQNVAAIYDPLEKLNRKIYVFNDFVDRYFVEYVAIAYRRGVPREARSSIRNVLDNLYAPISSVNSLLQGKPDNAMASFSNFLINSTVGVFGIFNVAKKKSIYYNKEDFGQTLGHYDIGSGAYLILPFFGPSSTRDFSGMAFDKSIHPLDFNFLEIGGRINSVDYHYRIALSLISGIDKRESLLDIVDDVRKDSFDPYATIRSAYLQKRAAEIKE
jgi:phospholipid-binding lipoprotein MlaA